MRTTDRRELLDDALCMIDEDLLARTLALRPRGEGRGAKRLVTVFGRQIPMLLASVAAIAVLVVGLAAVPSLVRLAGFLFDLHPDAPPVGGTVESEDAATEETTETDAETVETTETGAESDTSPVILDHNHDWSPWVPWGEDQHERHCQNSSCQAQVWEEHNWVPSLITDITDNITSGGRIVYECMECFDNSKTVPLDEVPAPKDLRVDGIASLKLFSLLDSAALNRTITDPALIAEIMETIRDAVYINAAVRVPIFGGRQLSIDIQYEDGTTDTLAFIGDRLSIQSQDVSICWQMSDEDFTELNRLLEYHTVGVADRTGELFVSGDIVDCGKYAPLFREYPLENGGSQQVALVPVTVTLRALGFTVGPFTDGKAEAVFEGTTFILSLDDISLTRKDNPYAGNFFLSPNVDGSFYAEVGETEMMLDTRALFERMILWRAEVNFDEGIVRIHDRREGEETETETDPESETETEDSLPLQPSSLDIHRLPDIETVTIRTEPESADLARTFTEYDQICELFLHIKNCRYEPSDEPAGLYTEYRYDITFHYADGTALEMQYLNNEDFGMTDADGNTHWYRLHMVDEMNLHRLIAAKNIADVTPEDTRCDYYIGETLVDCGEYFAYYVDGLLVETSNGSIVSGDYCCVPLLTTLRALGATVTDVDSATKEITYKGIVWTLTLSDRVTMKRKDGSSSINITGIAHPYRVGNVSLSADGQEVMIDTYTLYNRTLYYMEGEKEVWIVNWDAGDRRVILDEWYHGEHPS